jgi:alpha-L-fucosidase
VNGEAIYGTTFGPLQNLAWGRTTAKGKTVYLHIYDWPSGPLEVPGLSGTVVKARLLSGGQAVSFSQQDGRVTLKLPATAPGEHATVAALDFK